MGALELATLELEAILDDELDELMLAAELEILTALEAIDGALLCMLELLLAVLPPVQAHNAMALVAARVACSTRSIFVPSE